MNIKALILALFATGVLILVIIGAILNEVILISVSVVLIIASLITLIWVFYDIFDY